MLQPERSRGSRRSFSASASSGLGLIGGSIALAARQIWPAALVIGVDRKDVLERAMVLHAIDVAADDPVVLADADLVILAAPIQQNLEILQDAARQRRGLGGRHRHRQHQARDRRSRRVACRIGLTFIGGHPLGGAARGGIEHARPDMFTGRPWLFTPADRARRAGAREAEVVCVRPRRHPADVVSRRSRSSARLHQPSSSVDRQRADARRRRGGRARTV